MVKYTVTNEENLPSAFYDDEYFGAREVDGLPNPDCKLPPEAVEITQEQWVDLVINQGFRKLVDGEVVTYNPPAPQPTIPDRISRRQFRLQLIDEGLLTTVETWVATQNERTQAAYADSTSFLRSDAMLQAGFAALGFPAEHVDAFFIAASTL